MKIFHLADVGSWKQSPVTQLLYLYIKHNFYYKNSFLFVVVNYTICSFPSI